MGSITAINPKYVYVQSTEPSDLTKGKLWFDTINSKLYASDGEDYNAIEMNVDDETIKINSLNQLESLGVVPIGSIIAVDKVNAYKKLNTAVALQTEELSSGTYHTSEYMFLELTNTGSYDYCDIFEFDCFQWGQNSGYTGYMRIELVYNDETTATSSTFSITPRNQWFHHYFANPNPTKKISKVRVYGWASNSLASVSIKNFVVYNSGLNSYFNGFIASQTNNRFVDCNGQTLSDEESVFNGATIPDLNGYNSGGLNGNKVFLQGASDQFDGTLTGTLGADGTADINFYNVSWIMRVK